MTHNYQEAIDRAVEYIEALCRIPSPSGFTRQIERHVSRILQELGYEVRHSNKRSVMVCLGGVGEPVVVAAHLDTLGAMVRAVKPNGRLRITKVGGFPEVYAEGENCIIHARDGRSFTGTFCLDKPAVHVNKEVGTTKRDDTNIEIVIDELVTNPAEVRALGIESGDFVSFDPRVVVTPSGFIKSRHLDDKASAGVLLALAAWVREHKLTPKRQTWLLFTNWEEVGHGGSSGLPEGLVEFLSVDMGAVGEDLGGDETRVSIAAKDSNGPYDYDIVSNLVAAAKQRGLDFAVDTFPHYGSDAGAALFGGHDLRHGLIGPGVAVSHGYERTHRRGLEGTFSLLMAYLGLD